MKLFPTIRDHLAIMGFHELKPGENRFNGRNIGILLLFGFFLTLTSTYLIFDATTPLEYANTFFESITLVAICVGTFIIIRRNEIFFGLLKKFQTTLESRM